MLGIEEKKNFLEKKIMKKIIEQQLKTTFIGIHKFYTSYDSYTFKQNEFLMDRPIH